jgi:hypothetical protein
MPQPEMFWRHFVRVHNCRDTRREPRAKPSIEADPKALCVSKSGALMSGKFSSPPGRQVQLPSV